MNCDAEWKEKERTSPIYASSYAPAQPTGEAWGIFDALCKGVAKYRPRAQDCAWIKDIEETLYDLLVPLSDVEAIVDATDVECTFRRAENGYYKASDGLLMHICNGGGTDNDIIEV